MDLSGGPDAADSTGQGTTHQQTQPTADQASCSSNAPRWNMGDSDSQDQAGAAQTDTVYGVGWLHKQMSERNSEDTVPKSRILRRLFSSAMAHRLRAQSPHKYKNAMLLRTHLDILYTIFQGKAPQETANPFLLSLIEEYQKMQPVTACTTGESTSQYFDAMASTVAASVSPSSPHLQASPGSFSSDNEGRCKLQSLQGNTKDSTVKKETQARKPESSQIGKEVENTGDRQTDEADCVKTHLKEVTLSTGEYQSDDQTDTAGDSSTYKSPQSHPPKKVPSKKGMLRMGNRCYSCFECYNVFKNSIELRMHFLLHHPSRLPYIDGEDDILEARQVIQATVERGEHIDFPSISLQFPGITEEEFLRTKNSCMSMKDRIQTTVQGLPLTDSIKFVQKPMSVATVDSTTVRGSLLNGREEWSNGNRDTVLDLSAKARGNVDSEGTEGKLSHKLFHNHGNTDLGARNGTLSSAAVQIDRGSTQLTVKVKQEPNDLHEYKPEFQSRPSSEVPQNIIKKETVDKGVDAIPLATFLKNANIPMKDKKKDATMKKDPPDHQQVPETDLKKGIKRELDDNDGYLVKKTSSTRRKNTRPKRMRVDSNSWEEASVSIRTEKAMQDIQQWADQAGVGLRKETLTTAENSSSKFANSCNDEDGSVTKSVKGKAAALFKVKMCVDCNKTFRSHVDLKMHVLRNHPEKLPLLNWHAEDEVNTSTRPHSGSEPTAEESRPGLIYCTECESTFKMFMDLKMHVMRVHPEKLPDFEWPNRDQMRKRGNPYRRSKRAKEPSHKVKRVSSRSPKGKSHERGVVGSGSDKAVEEQFAQDGSLDLRMKKSAKKEVSSEILDLSVQKVPTPVTDFDKPSANGSMLMSFKQFTPKFLEGKQGYVQDHPERLSDVGLTSVQHPNTTVKHEQMFLVAREVPRGRSKNKYTRKCPMCPKQFRSLTMLKKHALAMHPGGLAEVCKDGSAGSNESELTSVPQSRVGSTSKGATIGDCNKITVTNTKVHRARAMNRKCPACDACFKALSRLKQHVLLEHPSKLAEVCEPDDEPPQKLPVSSSPKVVSCSECGAGFSTPIELKSHFLKQHPSKFTGVLKSSASNFPAVKRLGEHYIVLEDNVLYGHRCEECGMGFSTQEAKVTHLQKEHHSHGKSYGAALQLLVDTKTSKFRGKMHLCPQCGTGFSTEIERKRHVLEHHPGQFAEFAEVMDPLNLKVIEPVSHEEDKTKILQLGKLTGYQRKTVWGIPCPANCETRCKTLLDLKKHVLMCHPSWFGDVCRYSQEDIARLVLEKTPTVKSSLPSQDIAEDGNIQRTLSTGHRLIQAALLGSSMFQSEAGSDKTLEDGHHLKKETVDHSDKPSNGMAQTSQKGDSAERNNTRNIRRHWCPDCSLPFSNFLDLKFHVMMKHPHKLLSLNNPDRKPPVLPGFEPVNKDEPQEALPRAHDKYNQNDVPHVVLQKGNRKHKEDSVPSSLGHMEQLHSTTNRLLLPKPGRAWAKTQLMRLKQKSLSEEATKSKYARKVRWQCPECKSLFDHFLALKAHAVESHSFMLPLLDPESTKIRLDRKATRDITGETETAQGTC